MPLRRKRLLIDSARLLRKEHRQALVAGLVRIGARQNRHHVGADGMRDPRLLTGDLVNVAVLHRARLQRGKVGARVRLGENRRRQHFAGRDLGKIFCFLLRRAVVQDELARDLRARAERTDADVAARQLFRGNAHGFLAERHAAELFRQRQAENAELGELRDDLERNVFVLEMPLVGVRINFIEREAAHQILDLRVRLIETRIAERHRVGL